MAFGRKKTNKSNNVEEIINRINSAKGIVNLNSIAADIENLSKNYSPYVLQELRGALAKRYFDFGEKSKAKHFAELSNNKVLLMRIAYEEKNCDELNRRIVNYPEGAKYAGKLLECYFNKKEFESVLRTYRAFFERAPVPKAMYLAMITAIKLGETDIATRIYKSASELKDSNDQHVYLTLGHYYENMGQYEEAKEIYEKGIEKKATEDLHFALARSKYMLGDKESAKEILLELPSGDFRVKSMLSLIYSDEGHANHALEKIDSILSVDPDNVDVLLAKAEIMHRHKIGDAIELVYKVLSMEPYNPVALRIKAEALETKNPEESRKAYEALIKINPDDYNAYLGLAKLSEGAEKENHLEKVLEINSKCTTAKIMLAEHIFNEDPTSAEKLIGEIDDPRAYLLLAKLRYKNGDLAGAEHYARRALHQNESSTECMLLLARIIYTTRKEEAEELVRKTLNAEPNNREAKKLLASIIYKEHPQEALELIGDDNDREMMIVKAKVLKSLGRIDEAREIINSLINSNLESGDYLDLARISDDEDAILLLNKVLDLEPDNLEAKLLFAEKIVESNPEKAIDILEDITDPRAQSILGAAYMKQEKYKEAYEAFSACASMNQICTKNLIIAGLKLGKHKNIVDYAEKLVKLKESKENLYLLGDIYEHLGRDEAVDIYRKITLLYPGELKALNKIVTFLEKINDKAELPDYYHRLYDITKDVNYLIKRADILYEKGDFEGTYDTYTKILAEHPELEDIEDKRDLLLLKMGRYADLVQLADYWIAKGGAKASKGYYLRAIAYKNMGDLDNALENIRNATKSSSRKKYLIFEAQLLYELSKYDEAYTIISKVNAKSTEVLLLKSRILKNVGKLEEAEEILKKLEESGVPETYRELAEIYISLGDKEKGLDYLGRTIGESKDTGTYALGVKISYEIGDIQKTMKFINEGLKIAPNLPDFWLYKALALLKMDELNEALTSAENLIRIKRSPEYLLVKAKILNSLKRYEESYNILSSVHNVEFMDMNSDVELAYALYGMGEYRKSKRIYEALGMPSMVAKNLYMLEKYKDILEVKGDKPELLEVKGDASIKLGNVEEAKSYYEQASKLPTARKKLANLLYEGNDLNKAYEIYDTLDDPDSVFRQAKILEHWGQYREAADKYKEHYEKTGNTESGMAGVSMLMKLRQYNDALKILSAMPQKDDVIIIRAKIFYILGAYTKAIDILRGVNRQNVETYMLLGDIYMALGQPHRAREYYMKVLEEGEESTKILKSLANTYELTNNLTTAAEYYLKSGDDESLKRAERIYRRMVDTRNLKKLYEHILSKKVDIEAMKKLGEILLEEQNYKKALGVFKRVEEFEYSADILTKIGTIEIELKMCKEAERNLKKALEIGELQDTYVQLGRLYYLIRRYDEALNMLKSVPEDIYVMKELCKVYLKIGDMASALNYGEKIVDKLNDAESWYLFGSVLMDIGNYELAIKALKIAEEKGCTAHRVDLAKIYLNLKQYEKAIKATENADSEEAVLIRGLGYAKTGDYGNALKTLSSVEHGAAFRYLGDVHLIEATQGVLTYYPQAGALNLSTVIDMYSRSMRTDGKYTKKENTHNNLGIAYILMDDLVNGVEHLEMSGAELTNLFGAYMMLKEMDSAKKLGDKLYETQLKDAVYWNARGIFSSINSKNDEAMNFFNLSSKYAKEPIMRDIIAFNRALLLINLDMHKSALELLSSIRMRDAHLLRALVYFNTGDYNKARDNIKAIPDKDGNMHYIHAYVELMIGNYDNALKFINKALNKNSNNHTFWSLKGDILFSMGKYKDAERAFRVAEHIDDSADVEINMSAVYIMLERYDDAIEKMRNIQHEFSIYNMACAYARKGEYKDANKLFLKHYDKTKDTETLYNAYITAMDMGKPPVLPDDNLQEDFNLIKMLLSTYNALIIVEPTLQKGNIIYKMTIKNMSGDTISPFSIRPMLDASSVSIDKNIGPIRPYAEGSIEFITTRMEPEVYEEAGLVPGKHIQVEYKFYWHGVGIVEEIQITNLMKYKLTDIIVTPHPFESYEPWKESMNIDTLYPDETRIVRIPLLSTTRMALVKKWGESYEKFKPKMVKPPFEIYKPSYKILLRILPFEFRIKKEEVEYDVTKADELIRRERRRMLVRNVSTLADTMIKV